MKAKAKRKAKDENPNSTFPIGTLNRKFYIPLFSIEKS